MAKEIVDAISMKRALMRMTYEIIERNKGTENLVLIGIKTRGLYLAQRIAKNLKNLEDVDVARKRKGKDDSWSTTRL